MATAETPIAIHDPSLYETTRRADYLDTLADIDDHQIARFHEQGYLAIQRAFTPQQIESAGQAMWDLIDGKSPGLQRHNGRSCQTRTLCRTHRQSAPRQRA